MYNDTDRLLEREIIGWLSVAAVLAIGGYRVIEWVMYG